MGWTILGKQKVLRNISRAASEASYLLAIGNPRNEPVPPQTNTSNFSLKIAFKYEAAGTIVQRLSSCQSRHFEYKIRVNSSGRVIIESPDDENNDRMIIESQMIISPNEWHVLQLFNYAVNEASETEQSVLTLLIDGHRVGQMRSAEKNQIIEIKSPDKLIIGADLPRTKEDFLPTAMSVVRFEASVWCPNYGTFDYRKKISRRCIEWIPGLTGVWQFQGSENVCYNDHSHYKYETATGAQVRLHYEDVRIDTHANYLHVNSRILSDSESPMPAGASLLLEKDVSLASDFTLDFLIKRQSNAAVWALNMVDSIVEPKKVFRVGVNSQGKLIVQIFITGGQAHTNATDTALIEDFNWHRLTLTFLKASDDSCTLKFYSNGNFAVSSIVDGEVFRYLTFVVGSTLLLGVPMSEECNQIANSETGLSTVFPENDQQELDVCLAEIGFYSNSWSSSEIISNTARSYSSFVSPHPRAEIYLNFLILRNCINDSENSLVNTGGIRHFSSEVLTTTPFSITIPESTKNVEQGNYRSFHIYTQMQTENNFQSGELTIDFWISFINPNKEFREHSILGNINSFKSRLGYDLKVNGNGSLIWSAHSPDISEQYLVSKYYQKITKDKSQENREQVIDYGSLSMSPFKDSSWHHIAITQTKSPDSFEGYIIKFFLDGSQIPNGGITHLTKGHGDKNYKLNQHQTLNGGIYTNFSIAQPSHNDDFYFGHGKLHNPDDGEFQYRDLKLSQIRFWDVCHDQYSIQDLMHKRISSSRQDLILNLDFSTGYMFDLSRLDHTVLPSEPYPNFDKMHLISEYINPEPHLASNHRKLKSAIQLSSLSKGSYKDLGKKSFNINNSLTIEAWIKPQRIRDKKELPNIRKEFLAFGISLLDKTTETDPSVPSVPSVSILLTTKNDSNSNNKISLQAQCLWIDSDDKSLQGQILENPASIVLEDTWCHIAIVCDKTEFYHNVFSFFINSVLVATSNLPLHFDSITNNGQLFIKSFVGDYPLTLLKDKKSLVESEYVVKSADCHIVSLAMWSRPFTILDFSPGFFSYVGNERHLVAYYDFSQLTTQDKTPESTVYLPKHRSQNVLDYAILSTLPNLTPCLNLPGGGSSVQGTENSGYITRNGSDYCFTIEFWIKPREADFNQNFSTITNRKSHFFSGLGNDPTGYRTKLAVKLIYEDGASNENYKLAIEMSACNINLETTDFFCANQWRHFAITCGTSQTNSTSCEFRIYADGEIAGNAHCMKDTSRAFTFRLALLALGVDCENKTSTQDSYTGLVKEFKVWNGALSADEIKRRMYRKTEANESIPQTTGDDLRLICYMPFSAECIPTMPISHNADDTLYYLTTDLSDSHYPTKLTGGAQLGYSEFQPLLPPLPRIKAQSALMQTWDKLDEAQGNTEGHNAYRTVIQVVNANGTPINRTVHVRIWANTPEPLLSPYDDKTVKAKNAETVIRVRGVEYTISDSQSASFYTNSNGQIIVSVPVRPRKTDEGTKLTATTFGCHALKLYADFMDDNERVVILPDENLFEQMQAVKGSDLIMCEEPLIPLGNTNRRLTSTYTPEQADGLAQAINALASGVQKANVAELSRLASNDASTDKEVTAPETQSFVWDASEGKYQRQLSVSEAKRGWSLALDEHGMPTYTSGSYASAVKSSNSKAEFFTAAMDIPENQQAWNNLVNGTCSIQSIQHAPGDDRMNLTITYLKMASDESGATGTLALILETARQVGQLIYSLLNTAMKKVLGVTTEEAYERIMNFFSYYFNWDEILVTQRVLKGMLGNTPQVLDGYIAYFQDKVVNTYLPMMANQLDETLEKAKSALDGYDFGQIMGEKPSSFIDEEAQKLIQQIHKQDVKSNWMVDTLIEYAADSSNISEEHTSGTDAIGDHEQITNQVMANFVAPEGISYISDLLKQLYDEIMAYVTGDSQATTAFQEAYEYLKQIIHSPLNIVQLTLKSFITAMSGMMHLAMDILKMVANSMFNVLRLILSKFDEIINQAIEMPVLTWLYEKKITAGQPLTVANLVTIAAAIPINNLYKLMNPNSGALFTEVDVVYYNSPSLFPPVEKLFKSTSTFQKDNENKLNSQEVESTDCGTIDAVKLISGNRKPWAAHIVYTSVWGVFKLLNFFASVAAIRDEIVSDDNRPLSLRIFKASEVLTGTAIAAAFLGNIAASPLWDADSWEDSAAKNEDMAMWVLKFFGPLLDAIGLSANSIYDEDLRQKNISRNIKPNSRTGLQKFLPTISDLLQATLGGVYFFLTFRIWDLEKGHIPDSYSDTDDLLKSISKSIDLKFAHNFLEAASTSMRLFYVIPAYAAYNTQTAASIMIAELFINAGALLTSVVRIPDSKPFTFDDIELVLLQDKVNPKKVRFQALAVTEVYNEVEEKIEKERVSGGDLSNKLDWVIDDDTYVEFNWQTGVLEINATHSMALDFTITAKGTFISEKSNQDKYYLCSSRDFKVTVDESKKIAFQEVGFTTTLKKKVSNIYTNSNQHFSLAKNAISSSGSLARKRILASDDFVPSQSNTLSPASCVIFQDDPAPSFSLTRKDINGNVSSISENYHLFSVDTYVADVDSSENVILIKNPGITNIVVFYEDDDLVQMTPRANLWVAQPKTNISYIQLTPELVSGLPYGASLPYRVTAFFKNGDKIDITKRDDVSVTYDNSELITIRNGKINCDPGQTVAAETIVNLTAEFKAHTCSAKLTLLPPRVESIYFRNSQTTKLVYSSDKRDLESGRIVWYPPQLIKRFSDHVIGNEHEETIDLYNDNNITLTTDSSTKVQLNQTHTSFILNSPEYANASITASFTPDGLRVLQTSTNIYFGYRSFMKLIYQSDEQKNLKSCLMNYKSEWLGDDFNQRSGAFNIHGLFSASAIYKGVMYGFRVTDYGQQSGTLIQLNFASPRFSRLTFVKIPDHPAAERGISAVEFNDKLYLVFTNPQGKLCLGMAESLNSAFFPQFYFFETDNPSLMNFEDECMGVSLASVNDRLYLAFYNISANEILLSIYYSDGSFSQSSENEKLMKWSVPNSIIPGAALTKEKLLQYSATTQLLEYKGYLYVLYISKIEFDEAVYGIKRRSLTGLAEWKFNQDFEDDWEDVTGPDIKMYQDLRTRTGLSAAIFDDKLCIAYQPGGEYFSSPETAHLGLVTFDGDNWSAFHGIQPKDDDNTNIKTYGAVTLFSYSNPSLDAVEVNNSQNLIANNNRSSGFFASNSASVSAKEKNTIESVITSEHSEPHANEGAQSSSAISKSTFQTTS